MDRFGNGGSGASHGRLARLAVVAAGCAVLVTTLIVGTLSLTLPPPDPERFRVPAKYLPRLPGTPAPPIVPEPPAEAAAEDSGHGMPRMLAPAPRAPEPVVAPSAALDPPPSRAGLLEVDGAGHFRPTPGAIQLFREIHDEIGDWRREQARQAIEATIDRELAAPAASEARDLLDRYFRYVDATRALPPAGRDVRALAERLAETRAIERTIFGDALAATLFDPEHDASEAALARLIHRVDPSLAPSPDDRPTIGSHEAAPSGVAAAPRATDATWDARFAAYRVERDAILGDPSLDPVKRVDALNQLRERHFSGDEFRRAADLDRLDVLFPPSKRP